MKYTIIGKENCPQCKNAKSFANARKLAFEYKSVPEDISEEEAVTIVGGTFYSFPQIVVDKEDQIVTLPSFQEFMRFVNSKS